MDPLDILWAVLIIGLIVLVVVVVMVLIRLMKTMQSATETINKLEPTLKNVEAITKDLQPTVKKIEPVVDRITLTLDSVNLEMMRVDKILEDVSQITGSAASASNAVDHITNAPVKAVSGMADKVRLRFGSKGASDASAQLGEQRAAVEQALEEYKAADAAEAMEKSEAESVGQEPGQSGYVEVEEPSGDAKAAVDGE